MSEQRMRQGVGLLGVLQLLTGLSLVIAPGSFYDAIATFGARNDHFLRDYGSYYLASGIALLLAGRRPSWRVPVLFIVTVQYGLHALNHLLDIGDSDPGWLGPLDFVALAGLTALLAYMLHAAAAAERPER
jgi:hypothetical protein